MPYESLVGNSEVIGIEFVSQDSYSNRLYVDTDVGHYDSQHRHGGSQYNRRGSRDYQETPISTSPPQIYIDTTSVQPQYEDNFVPLEDFPDDYGPISPLRRGWDSIRGPLSRSHSAVSSIGTSRANSLSTRPSQRSHRGTSRSTSLSSRFSFRRSRSSGRTRDIEMGAGNYIPGEQIEGIDPVELESLAHTFGPFELYSLDSREQGRLLRRAAVGNQKTVPHKRIIENLFGLHLCSPQYHGLRRTYMAQVDKKLKGALYESSVANPNPAVWPKPFAYLVGFLGLVSQQMEPTSSVTAFILSHMDDFAEMIRNGNISPPEKSQSSSLPSGGEKAAMAIAWGFDDTDNFTPWHQKIVHEWMLFSLESWFMLDLYPSNDNRRDLVSSQTFCESSIQDLIKPHLPETAFRSSWLSPTGSQPSIIVSGDVTASMLQRWNGITFRWTPNIKDHLQFDSRNNVLMLYENVAFCQLHSIAKENSSLQSVLYPILLYLSLRA